MTFNTRRLLREPLFHFLVLGALLFVIFHFVKGSGETNREEIVVASGTIRTLSENFQRVWQRPPTQQELDNLVQEHIKEEIYYREALALGLDRDDTIIKRRLRQKMEFLVDGIGDIKEPTDKDLQSYLEKHKDKFQVESRFTFSHVYLNPDRHLNSMQKDAAELLSKLNNTDDSIDTTQFGDSFMLGYYFSNQPESVVARTFGEQFAKQLNQVETGKWVGPVESGYGVHLVKITDRAQGELPPLQAIRNEVERDWMSDQQKQLSERFFESIRSRYKVRIDQEKIN
jgi:hypothetical protein